MQRQIDAAIRRINPVSIEITADTTRFRNAVRDLQDRFQDIEVQVVPDVDRATFVAAVQSAIVGAEVTINVVPDLSGIDAAIRAHNPPDLTVDVDADTDRFSRSVSNVGKSIGSTLANITKMTLAIGALGIAAAGSAVAVAGFVSVMSSAVGLLAAAPAVVLGLQAVMGGLKLAIQGVGDAFSAALTEDAEAFTKATEDLSPAAKAAAQEVRALRPVFEDLKNTVQDNFFQAFEGEITATANALKGPLKDGLMDISDEWGDAAKGALDYIQSASGVTNIDTLLQNSEKAFTGFTMNANALTAGLLQSADAIANAYGAELGSGIDGVTKKFADFLSTAAGDGRLVMWVDEALNTLAQLGDILGNIGGAISGVFQAGETAGGGFLKNLQTITASFENFVKSAEGQAALTNIFQTLAAVAAQLGPIFAALVTTLGEIAPAITPLLTAVGPAIVGLIEAIGPLIAAIMPAVQTAIGAILDLVNEISASGALQDLGEVLASVLDAVLPLVPVVAQLATSIVQALAPAFVAVAEAVTPVVQALADAFLPILPGLVSIVLQITEALAPFVEIIGRVLAQAIEAAAPLLITLSQALFTIADAVVPLVEQLLNAFLPVIDMLVPVVERLVVALTPLIEAIVAALLPLLPPLVDAFIALLNAVLPLIEPVVQLVEALAPMLTTVTNLLAPVLQLAAEILNWLSLEVVVPVIEGIVDILSGLLQMATDVADGVRQFAQFLIDTFTFLANDSGRVIGQMVSSIGQWFSNLWKSVTNWVSRLANDVGKWFGEMYRSAVRWATNLVNDTVNWFRSLPGKVYASLSSLANQLAQRMTEAANRFLTAARKFVTDAVNAVKALPNRVRQGLGNLGSYLYSAGVDLIRGMINGIKSMAGSIAGAARDVAAGAVNGVKSFLGIQSPSKVFRQIGVFVGQGFVNGLTASESSIERTADRLADLIVKAFEGQRTKRDDALVRLVRENQRELETLVTQRERIAERIRKANEFALQTAEQARQSFGIGDLFQDVNEELKKLRERALAPGLVGNNVVGALTQRVQDSANRIRRFTKQIEDLAKRGLNRNLISQLIGLGPEAGADLAQQLSRTSDAQLRDLSKAQNALDAAAKKFGQNSADLLYDAGENAAKGFLAGLRGQQKEIEQLMVSIAKSMQAAIKKALGIKSPSTVFRSIGIDSGQGLVNGLDAMVSNVVDASRSMAAAVVEPFGAGPSISPVGAAVRPVDGLARPFGTPAAPVGYAGAYGAAARPGENVTVNNTFVINEVGNAEATASRVVNRLALAAGVL